MLLISADCVECGIRFGVAEKNLSCFDAHELRKLVDSDHPELSISIQCALLGLPRSTHYYRPKLVRATTLRIMVRIDALYLEDPSGGSRRLVEYLAREGIPISRDWVRNLMLRMGLRAIYQNSRTTVPGEPSERFPCLVDLKQVRAADQIWATNITISGCIKDSSSLTGGDRGSVLQKRAQLEALEQP